MTDKNKKPSILKHEHLPVERKYGLSETPEEWVKTREKHYRKHFGKPSLVVHEVLPQIPHIDVLVFPSSKKLKRNFTTLVTSGMSDEKMFLPEGFNAEQSRTEKDTIEGCNLAIEENSEDAEAYNNRGLVWQNQGNYDKAIADFSETIRLDSLHAEAYNNRGFCWSKKGDFVDVRQNEVQ